VCKWQVKLYGPIVTRGPDLSAIETKVLIIKYCINSSVYFFIFTEVLCEQVTHSQ